MGAAGNQGLLPGVFYQRLSDRGSYGFGVTPESSDCRSFPLLEGERIKVRGWVWIPKNIGSSNQTAPQQPDATNLYLLLPGNFRIDLSGTGFAHRTIAHDKAIVCHLLSLLNLLFSEN
jgi:hypothetical protein